MVEASIITFSKMMVEELVKKDTLERVTLVNFSLFSTDVVRYATTLQPLLSLPRFKSLHLPYFSPWTNHLTNCSAWSQFINSMTDEQSNKITGSVYLPDKESTVLEYSKYMLEKLQLPIRSFTLRSGYDMGYSIRIQFVHALLYAVQNKFTNMALYLINRGAHICCATFTEACRSNQRHIVRVILETLAEQLNNVFFWLEKIYIMPAAIEILSVALPHLTNESAARLIKNVISETRFDILKLFAVNFPKIIFKDDSRLKHALYLLPIRNVSISVAEYLIKEHGLSFLLPNEHDTYMMHVISNVQPWSKSEEFAELIHFIHRVTPGGLCALLAQELEMRNSYNSGLRMIITQIPYRGSPLHVLEKIIGPTTLYNLTTNVTKMSLLQLMASYPIVSTYYADAAMTEFVTEILRHSPLEAKINSMFFVRNRFSLNMIVNSANDTDEKEQLLNSVNDHERTPVMHRLCEITDRSKIRNPPLDASIEVQCLIALFQLSLPFVDHCRRDTTRNTFLDHTLEFIEAHIKVKRFACVVKKTDDPTEIMAKMLKSEISALSEGVRDQVLFSRKERPVIDKIVQCAKNLDVLGDLLGMDDRLTSELLSTTVKMNVTDNDSIENLIFTVKNYNVFIDSFDETSSETDKMTPLQFAILKRNESLSLAIVRNGTDPALPKENVLKLNHKFRGKTALYMACENGLDRVYEKIVRAHPDLLNQSDHNSLYNACLDNDHDAIALKLLVALDIVPKSRNHLISLIVALIRERTRFFSQHGITKEKLLRWEQHFNTGDVGEEEWAEWLSKSWFQMSGFSSTSTVSTEKDVPMLFKICDDSQFQPLVHFLAEFLYGECFLQVLLKVKNGDSDTVLHYVQQKNLPHGGPLSRILLEGCGDPRKDARINTLINAKDSANGDTALHMAVKRADEQSIRALINHGASLNINNNQHRTPTQHCSLRVEKMIEQCDFDPKKRYVKPPEKQGKGKRDQPQALAGKNLDISAANSRQRNRKRVSSPSTNNPPGTRQRKFIRLDK